MPRSQRLHAGHYRLPRPGLRLPLPHYTYQCPCGLWRLPQLGNQVFGPMKGIASNKQEPVTETEAYAVTQVAESLLSASPQFTGPYVNTSTLSPSSASNTLLITAVVSLATTSPASDSTSRYSPCQ